MKNRLPSAHTFIILFHSSLYKMIGCVDGSLLNHRVSHPVSAHSVSVIILSAHLGIITPRDYASDREGLSLVEQAPIDTTEHLELQW